MQDIERTLNQSGQYKSLLRDLREHYELQRHAMDERSASGSSGLELDPADEKQLVEFMETMQARIELLASIVKQDEHTLGVIEQDQGGPAFRTLTDI
jgi:hypothetical protein